MRNKNVVINIPSDGLDEEVIRETNADEEVYRQNVRRYISEFLNETVCGRMFFNVCYKRSVVHSDVADTVLYNVERDQLGNVKKTETQPYTQTYLNRGYRETLRRNIDIIGMALKECKSYGVEGWFSFRMNDHHYPDDGGFNSVMGYEQASELGVNGSRTYLDYTKERVREYYKAYIKELCKNYEIDGIELDFLRSCPIMSEPTSENICKINNFIRELRELTQSINPNLQMAVRVYPTIERNLGFGLDVAEWIADGAIDIITAENWYIPTWFDIPVESWRECIAQKNKKEYPYTLLCGTDWGVECDGRENIGRQMWISLEQFKGFAAGAYSRGADGIYIFNHFNTDDNCHCYKNLGLYTCYIDEKGNKFSKNVLKSKINSANSMKDAETGMRTYVNTYSQNSPYPVEITKEKSFAVKMNTTSKAKNYFRVIVGLMEKDEICVQVNDKVVTKSATVKAVNGFVYENEPMDWAFVDHVSEVAPVVLQFEADLSLIQDGFNKIEILAGDVPVTMKWLEIQVE